MKRAQTRRLAGLSALIAVCALLFGCTGYELAPVVEQQASGTASQSDPSYTSQLYIDIGMIDIEPTVLDMIIKVYQEKYPEVEVITHKLSEEEMAKGRDPSYPAPDILYVNGLNPSAYPGSPADIYAEMEKGTYLDLSAMWDVQPGDGLNSAMLDVGLHKGQRYIVPICFQVPALLTSQEIMQNLAFDPNACTDLSGLFGQVSSAQGRLSGEKAVALTQQGAFQIFPFSGPGGIYDREQGAIMDRAAFQQFCESYKPYAAADGLTQQDQLKYNTDALSSFLRTGSADAVAFYLEDMGFTIMEGYLQLKADGQTPVILPIPDFKGSAQAQMAAGLAIASDSPNKENAYKFIKTMLSSDVQREIHLGFHKAPVYTAVVEDNLRGVLGQGSATAKSSQPLTDEDAQAYMDVLSSITTCTLPDPAVEDIFYACMSSYFEGKTDFDTCYDQMTSQLRSRLS